MRSYLILLSLFCCLPAQCHNYFAATQLHNYPDCVHWELAMPEGMVIELMPPDYIDGYVTPEWNPDDAIRTIWTYKEPPELKIPKMPDVNILDRIGKRWQPCQE